MQELGSSEFGEFFLSRSLDNLDEDEALSRSIFKVIIPHYFSYTMWRRRAALLNLGIRSNNPRINRDDQRDIVLEALYFALIARHSLGKLDGLTLDDRRGIEYAVSNNIISYIWEIFDLASPPEAGRGALQSLANALSEEVEDYTPGSLETIARPILEAIEGPVDGAASHDTLMKLHHILGSLDKAAFHKGRVNDLMMAEGMTNGDQVNDLYLYAQARVEPARSFGALADNLML